MTDIVDRLRAIDCIWSDGELAAEAANHIVYLGIEISHRAYDNRELQQQLAASQAREKVLRDALSYVAYDEGGYVMDPDAAEVLEAPTDDSSLKAALAAEREKCAVVMERQHTWISNVAAANIIRALEN